MSWFLALGGGVAAYWALMVVAQRWVMFPGSPFPVSESPAEQADVRRAYLGPESDWEVWYLLPHGRTPAPTILFAHGNGESIDVWAEPFSYLQRLGIGVVLVEYPGYGRSGGQPSRASVVAAMITAYDYAAAQPEVDRERILGYGRSLGGAAVAELSEHRPLAGLVLESTFTSVRDIAARYGMFGPLVRNAFDNRAILKVFPGPVLLLHGEQDRIIPVTHSRELAQLSPRAELSLVPCGHNDCPRPWPRLLEFLQAHDLRPGGAERPRE